MASQTAGPAAALSQIKQIKQTVSLLKKAKDPYALVMAMPGAEKAKEYIAKCGGDQQKALEQLAQERGIDIEQVLSALR